MSIGILCGAFLILLNGLKDLVPLFTAALLHEFAHLAVCFHYRVPTRLLSISPLGLSIAYDALSLSYHHEFLIAAAGPLANLIAFAVCFLLPAGRFTLLFGTGSLALAVFNLIPLTGLDGGVLLSTVLMPRVPLDVCWRICRIASVFWTVLLFAVSALFQLRCGGNLSLLILSVYFLFSLVHP